MISMSSVWLSVHFHVFSSHVLLLRNEVSSFKWTHCRWERRVDPNNRVYYVDHNMRTTTWHPPSENLLHNVVRWRQWYDLRAGNMRNHMSQLYNSSGWTNGGGNATHANSSSSVPEALGPLPEGFGKLVLLLIQVPWRVPLQCASTVVILPHSNPSVLPRYSYYINRQWVVLVEESLKKTGVCSICNLVSWCYDTCMWISVDWSIRLGVQLFLNICRVI